MSPLYSIRPEAVAIVDAADKPAILERLSQAFAKSWNLDAAEVLEQLEERERLGSTGFGRGVAIPHARVAGLDECRAAFLRLGMGGQSPHGERESSRERREVELDLRQALLRTKAVEPHVWVPLAVGFHPGQQLCVLARNPAE